MDATGRSNIRGLLVNRGLGADLALPGGREADV